MTPCYTVTRQWPQRMKSCATITSRLNRKWQCVENQAVRVPGYIVCLQTPKICLCIPLMSFSRRLTYHNSARFLVWVRVCVCERNCVCVCVSACVLVLVFTSRQILIYCTFYSLEVRRVHQSGPLESCMCSFEREHVCSHTPMPVSIQCNVLQINGYRGPQWNTVCLQTPKLCLCIPLM